MLLIIERDLDCVVHLLLPIVLGEACILVKAGALSKAVSEAEGGAVKYD